MRRLCSLMMTFQSRACCVTESSESWKGRNERRKARRIETSRNSSWRDHPGTGRERNQCYKAKIWLNAQERAMTVYWLFSNKYFFCPAMICYPTLHDFFFSSPFLVVAFWEFWSLSPFFGAGGTQGQGDACNFEVLPLLQMSFYAPISVADTLVSFFHPVVWQW